MGSPSCVSGTNYRVKCSFKARPFRYEDEILQVTSKILQSLRVGTEPTRTWRLFDTKCFDKACSCQVLCFRLFLHFGAFIGTSGWLHSFSLLCSQEKGTINTFPSAKLRIKAPDSAKSAVSGEDEGVALDLVVASSAMTSFEKGAQCGSGCAWLER